LILVLVGVVAMLTHTIGYELDQEKHDVSSVSVYLQDSASLASIDNFEMRLEADPRVKSVTFVDKDAVEEEQRIRDPSYVQERSVLGYNTLPARLDIVTKNLNDLGTLNNIAKASPLADHSPNLAPTSYRADVIGTLQNIANVVQFIGIGLSLVLLFISLVIIMNTIRTAVFTRRAEVEIMKLVGATDWFVRWPFILEGMLGGILAAVVAGVLVHIGYRLFIGFTQSSLLGIPLDSGFEFLVIALLTLFGIVLGGLGSYLGIRRFLNV
jgi:cell division transport system permease protein